MIFRTLIAAALLATAAARADFDRTLTVSAQPDLYVSTGSGQVHVFSGTDSQLHIKARVHAGWNAGGDIDDRIRQINGNPPIRQSGNEVHVGDVSPEDRRLYNNITIDYEISAPRLVALNLHTGSGDLAVDNLSRFLKADTGSGSIHAKGVAGPADLHTGSGDIDFQGSAPGEIKASTGSGSIRLNGISGPLNARTGSGDIEANGAITGPSRLQSGSGSIRAHVGRDTRLNVEASTGSGAIRVAGNSPSDRAHHLSTALNGGGPTLEARTGSGDIAIN